MRKVLVARPPRLEVKVRVHVTLRGRRWTSRLGSARLGSAELSSLHLTTPHHTLLHVNRQDKAAQKKMNKANGRAFNRMKLNLRKHNAKFEAEIKAFRENPEIEEVHFNTPTRQHLTHLLTHQRITLRLNQILP